MTIDPTRAKPDEYEALVELGAIAIYGCYNPALDWNYPGHRAAKAECRTFARAVIAAIRREAMDKWPTERMVERWIERYPWDRGPVEDNDRKTARTDWRVMAEAAPWTPRKNKA